MANFTKWLGAGLGFTLGGPIGAAIGFAIGSFVDGFSSDEITAEQREYQRKINQKKQYQNTQSGDFEISLLVLASIVIKSDGKIDQRELSFVRTQFYGMYGEERAKNAFKIFKEVIKQQVSARQVCLQIREHMPHASRLQLIHFLFGIAKADDFVSETEIEEIRKIAGYLYINHSNFESIKAMFYDDIGNAYTILEIEKNATDDEVKKAYRTLAKKHHPDKLQDLGDEHLKGAQEKFQSIQAAYEKIKKERGF
ncbi:MAG: DnaJ domain-containing protein [Flavobacteriia bacterium]|nr:DnaJ domain-containing protein [Flavobacteriia bacterium]OIP45481.1 MAG: molecular chaperone DjlA [Flavobacteriaceae bacterium CG2_30_31_66]PIV97644.1 MAG: molecular chaperone DjlA [Flavobacteriaceae bacterium CG17_big_fil_post_rev_8_21_14_2_50_31_13]PIZ11751.1 MAG: molecular chaperone DjlA [Flavobacteriaceae bacterium CG_4_10_14_0_8_um_filter_31_99]PJC11117.1 MAG: molecular chaperone DjlA [Flavobacteriaceae bacterium CG_4_9_14_0_8_um_filter_31_91]